MGLGMTRATSSIGHMLLEGMLFVALASGVGLFRGEWKSENDKWKYRLRMLNSVQLNCRIGMQYKIYF
jgi:hypothetical protein